MLEVRHWVFDMAEPENHTLRLMREIRDTVSLSDRKLDGLAAKVDASTAKTDALAGKTDALAAKTESLADAIDAVDAKLDRVHADLKDRVDHLTQAVAGEIV